MSTATLSIEARLEKLRGQIDDDLRAQRTGRRDLRKDHVRYLERTYGNMSECHETQAWQHTVALIGALFQIYGIGGDDAWRTTMTGISQFCQQTTGVTVKFTDGELNRFQGLLEELRDALSEGSKREDDVRRIIQEVNQMMESAIERANRSKSSPFNPS